MLKLMILLGVNGFIETVYSPLGKENSSLPQNKMKTTHSDFVQDFSLDAPKLIKKYGYPIKIHEIKTEDGYLLTMHRINGQEMNQSGNGSGIPVMMMHGYSRASTDSLINGPRKSLGYILADDGYDVWLGNSRGSRYSRKHVSIDPDKGGKFWQFSWHEIGLYDLPACIDYILEKTKKEKLHFVGHSQGNTVFFVMASTKPKYNEKIASMHALAPTVFISHAKNPMVKLAVPISAIIHKAFPLLGIHEFKQTEKMRKYIVHRICNETSVTFSFRAAYICLVNGFDLDELNTANVQAFMSRLEEGASSKQMLDYTQLLISGKFRQYDYGKVENMLKYGQAKASDYNLTKVTAPVALYYSENDYVTDPIDVKLLHETLPNVIGLFNIEKFNHVDYIIAINTPTLVYNKLRKLLLKY